MASRAILSNFFEEQWTQNHPQYLSGLSRALFPTTFLELAVYHDGQANRSSRIALSNDSVFNNLHYPRPSILLSPQKTVLRLKKTKNLGGEWAKLQTKV